MFKERKDAKRNTPLPTFPMAGMRIPEAARYRLK